MSAGHKDRCLIHSVKSLICGGTMKNAFQWDHKKIRNECNSKFKSNRMYVLWPGIHDGSDEHSSNWCEFRSSRRTIGWIGNIHIKAAHLNAQAQTYTCMFRKSLKKERINQFKTIRFPNICSNRCTNEIKPVWDQEHILEQSRAFD